MLASNRCAGTRGSWCATQLSVHALSSGSPSSCTASRMCRTCGNVMTAVSAVNSSSERVRYRRVLTVERGSPPHEVTKDTTRTKNIWQEEYFVTLTRDCLFFRQRFGGLH